MTTQAKDLEFSQLLLRRIADVALERIPYEQPHVEQLPTKQLVEVERSEVVIHPGLPRPHEMKIPPKLLVDDLVGTFATEQDERLELLPVTPRRQHHGVLVYIVFGVLP